MDVLEALLDGPRARGAFLLRSLLDPPWSLRIEDGAPLTVVTPLRGTAYVVPAKDTSTGTSTGTVTRLATSDVAIVRGPGFYTVADDPATAPAVVVLPGGLCTSAEDGRSLVDEWSLGVRTWGTRADAETVLLTATYEHSGEASRPLLSALPHVAVLRHDEWHSPLVDLLAREITVEAPGQRSVLDRLLDVLLVSALRQWFTSAGDQPAWYRGQQDPVVGHALGLMHGRPEQPWTVASLAGATGVSRAALARRFTEVMGEPPMAYLTGWRLALAADLLVDPGATVAGVARKVGYSTPFALSAAFKRERGISPQQHRARGATA